MVRTQRRSEWRSDNQSASWLGGLRERAIAGDDPVLIIPIDQLHQKPALSRRAELILQQDLGVISRMTKPRILKPDIAGARLER
jgi:hypothetical protein